LGYVQVPFQRNEYTVDRGLAYPETSGELGDAALAPFAAERPKDTESQVNRLEYLSFAAISLFQ
jgi:hypothetical protein